jgi:hypothetical protein
MGALRASKVQKFGSKTRVFTGFFEFPGAHPPLLQGAPIKSAFGERAGMDEACNATVRTAESQRSAVPDGTDDRMVLH